MIIVLLDHIAVTPEGSPSTVPIPVVIVVVCLIAGKSSFIHTVGEEEAVLTELDGEIFKIPVADTFPQPPVNGIV